MSDSPSHHGVRIKNDLNVFVPADQKIRPRRNNILLEPIDWQPSKIIKVEYHGEPLWGRVLAVGPGAYAWKYDGPKGKRTKKWESNVFVPVDLKVGEFVDLGGLELRGYLFNTFLWGAREVIMCTEQDVAYAGVPDEPESPGIGNNGQSLAVA